MKRIRWNLSGLLLLIFISTTVYAQIDAPGAVFTEATSYPVFNETDSIFVFCVENEGLEIGALQVTTNLSGTKTFLWEKYNPAATAFEFYFSESSETNSSQITALADGGYRVSITQGASSEIYRAWVFNNWISVKTSVSESDCESFKLNGEFSSASLIYYDLSDNSEINLYNTLHTEWKKENEIVAAVANPQIFNPPTKDTKYTLRVFDRFGCETTSDVTYQSIVTKARFTADPPNGEAPLEVTFSNQSENGDPDKYEWFFFRNLDEIKKEAEQGQSPIDSIMIVAYDENPVFTFENTGQYMVKLVSKKVSEFHTCVDTFYLEDYIIVDTSFVQVPNVFTPNGDGTNDLLVVKFWSMQSIKISIFNRWGKRVHYWEHNNIRGFENTYMETVWDGRLMGGRFASPGVYFYNVVGDGRDGKERRAHGFIHLFRGKNQ